MHEHEPPLPAEPPGGYVVLGLGGCVDEEIVWDPDVLTDLALRWDVRLTELSIDVQVASERDLLVSILAFARSGVGGERYVVSGDVLSAFVGRFRHRTALGGTNVRASAVLSAAGVDTLLHLVSVNDVFRSRLPPKVGYLCSGSQSSWEPHLIVQFVAGSTIHLVDGELVVRRANRLIYVHDPANQDLRLDPRLGDVLGRARLFLVSGFNAMQDEAAMRTRLGELRDHMAALPQEAVVVVEEAGYHRPALAGLLRQALADRLDVCSMNEDELQEILGRSVGLDDPVDVARALQELHGKIPVPVLVVHTARWAAAVGPRARELRAALDLGLRAAAARYRYGNDTPSDAWLTGEPGVRDAVDVRFGRDLEDQCDDVVAVAGYRIDTERPTTVGLGDTFIGGVVASLARTPLAPKPR